MNWKNWKIGVRLSVGFGLVVLLAGILGFVALTEAGILAEQTNHSASLRPTARGAAGS